MSLATRCPSCATVFRVVRDQLKVSEGWVRCGRCNSVFNAAEVLFDIDSGTPVHLVLDDGAAPDHRPPPVATIDDGPVAEVDTSFTVTDWHPPSWPDSPVEPGQHPETSRPPPPRAKANLPEGRQEPRFDGGPATWLPASRTDPALDPALDPLTARVAEGRLSQREEPLLRTPSSQADDDPGLGDAAPAFAALPPLSRPVDLPASSDNPALPSFLRTADPAALWRRPAMRGALIASVVLLSLGGVAQALWTWRDRLAAQLPASEPALQAMCRLVGCQLQPLRRIDALAVDSSGLNRLEHSTLYRLQLVLHNRADTALMMPALDLSLTDSQGRLVTRRVLQMAELGAPQAVLQAGQELPIKALVATGDRRIDGYTVELFYP